MVYERNKNVGKWWIDTWREKKPKDLGRNIFQCHYFHYKSHIELPGLKPDP
jgi:hypothetical protein